MGNKLKEFILKQLISDPTLKERWRIFTERRFGAMARIIGQYPDLKDMILPPVHEIDGNQHVLKFFECMIRSGLFLKIKDKFGENAGGIENNEEFEIAYLEAKEDLLGQRKAKTAVSDREEKKLKRQDVPKSEKYDYELFTSGKKIKFITSPRAEKIRETSGLCRKNEIFIDDERKDVYFKNKLIKDFKDQNYALLIHFVKNEGVGGSSFALYESIWGESKPAQDDLNNAVEKAVSRFRSIIKKYKIGDVPPVSKSKYSVSKTYIMKPKPKYCILRKIEKEIEE